MIDVLQKLVEDLAQRLQRSVTVDDAALRLVVSSTHFADADPARLSSLLARNVVGEGREYLLRAGIMTWTGVHRMPPNASVGAVHGRVCYPLRSRYELLGFMTIIDDGTMTDEEMAAADITAQELQRAMAGRMQSLADDDLETEALVLALLSPARADRSQAAQDLLDFGLFKAAQKFRAIVVSVTEATLAPSDEPVADLVRRALLFATKGLTPTSYAYAATGTESCLVLSYRSTAKPQESRRLATHVHREIAGLSRSLAKAATVGIGDVQNTLAELSVSFDQAMSAVRVGRIRRSDVNCWGDAPLEELLSALLVSDHDPQMVPSMLRALDVESAEIKSMLEVFLDRAGNVISTAEQLHLHRTTIYYRLTRLQKLTGLDLEDGRTRLMVHLWLKAQAYMNTTQV